jgi:hypothetical protein
LRHIRLLVSYLGTANNIASSKRLFLTRSLVERRQRIRQAHEIAPLFLLGFIEKRATDHFLHFYVHSVT